MENQKLISVSVSYTVIIDCDVLNNFYINVVGSENQQHPICVSDSFEDIVGDFSNHPSVRYIKRNFVNNTFNFHSVTG